MVEYLKTAKDSALAALLFFLLPLAASGLPGRGVPETLADQRAASIRGLRYDLTFRIPESRAEPITGVEELRFDLVAPEAVVLDFEQPPERIRSVGTAGGATPFEFVDGHILLPASAMRSGSNTLRIEFIAGDESLNRSDDFLYTLFVPARARYAFPCFDQPNLKGRYTLTVDVPAPWQVVANGAETGRESSGGRTVVRFAPTEPLPTYLFAFAAGKFQVETAQRRGRTLRMFHRETDAAKVARNREVLFDLHARALAYMEDYTAIPYPWGKFDFVLFPSFQFGGMEHPGAIFYDAAGLLLDPAATQAQELARANVICHETAHMWFGDLVTMRWFNDVWLKEVMANFMAAKMVNPSFPEMNHDLRFLLAHYPPAYSVDRSAGANPIRQPLANLTEAGSLYGQIIYHKAPVVMRQVELILGEPGLRDALREYLRRYSFGNATWSDLVTLLEARQPGQVALFSRAWVEERGRPEIGTELTVGADGTVADLELRQRDPLGRGLVWPQRLQVTVGFPDRVAHYDVAVAGPVTVVKGVRGAAQPLYVIPNGAGLGYGLFKLDAATLRYLLSHLEEISDPLTRGSAWVDLWENLLEGRVEGAAFLDLAMRALPRESDEQNRQRILSYAVRAFWHELPAQPRTARAGVLEGLLRAGLARAITSSQKSAWFNAYREVVLTPDGLAWLERVWRREEKIPGLTFAETDEMAMAANLALREVPGWEQILATQRDRIHNPDRRAQFEFVMPALSADPSVRETAFGRLRDVSQRRREPWALETLRYLNHPLREKHARRFVLPALELLPEIQRTGDIFFPVNWMDATLSGHNSPEVAATVQQYLDRHRELPERLRWVVQVAADELFRMARKNR